MLHGNHVCIPYQLVVSATWLAINVCPIMPYGCAGLTLQTVSDRVLAAGAASVKSCVALDKRARRKVHFECDYVGFVCPDVWVAGLGMDTNQLYRSLVRCADHALFLVCMTQSSW